MRLYYAQNKEDLLIGGFFPDVDRGFYIDVGANDPVHDSVTKLFYDNGWRGINVEPIQKHWEALQKQRPEDINLQIGLSNKAGRLQFTEYPEGDGLSTFDVSMQKMYEAGKHNFPTRKIHKYEVEVRTLQSVVEEVKPKHIHFIKVDVEGYEYEVIKGYDWRFVRPELVCIEANHIHKDWRPMLENNSYEFVFFDGVNNYYLAKESLYRKKYFNYPDIAFSGNPIYYPTALEIEREESAKADKKIKAANRELRTKIADQEQKIASLHNQQRDVRFLTKQLAREVQMRLDKRAKSVTPSPHLHYSTDERVAALAQSAGNDKDELLTEVHQLDKQNIAHRYPGMKERLKPVAWKGAAKSARLAARVARKVRRRG